MTSSDDSTQVLFNYITKIYLLINNHLWSLINELWIMNYEL
jgi:hypothetical protein